MNQVAPVKDFESEELRNIKLPAVSAGFFDLQSFQLMQRVAKGFSASSLVPKDYRGNTPEAIGNCMIALNLARRIGADPLMVMQNLNIVHGRPAWSSQFLIASVNTCGRFSALRYEFFGTRGLPDWGCRAWAIERSTGERLVGADITMELAQKEGWLGRNGSKWGTMPQQMLIYRAGAWWCKAYAPELSMGLMTAEESYDAGPDIDRREERRSFADASARPGPKTIEARLNDFAGDTTSNNTDPADAGSRTPAEAGDEAAAATQQQASEESASGDANGASADSAKIPDNIRDAMAKGRAARISGHGREVPRNLQYKSKQAEADAFLAGWDEEDWEIKAADGGTV